MSKSRGCLLIELNPGEWWCAVAYDEYDHEFRSGEKFGPAKTEEGAWQMMVASNPGSSRTVPFAAVTAEHRKLLARLHCFRHSRYF